MSVRVKICGLTTPEVVQVAVDAGADAIGLVFAASPRQVDPVRAAELLAAVPPGIERIAVFRRPDRAAIDAISHLPLHAVQADAGWNGVGWLPDEWYFLPAFRDGTDLLGRLAAFSHPHAAALDDLRGAVLLDGPGDGGAGVRADTGRAAAAAKRVRLVLAGGLSPGNVGAAIAAVRPYGVDVSSGVESTRGVKDPATIRAFLEAVRKEES